MAPAAGAGTNSARAWPNPTRDEHDTGRPITLSMLALMKLKNNI
jgi:hypothetical protein